MPALRVLGRAALFSFLLVSPALAANHEADLDFQLDTWLDFDQSEGAITLHRVQLEQRWGSRVPISTAQNKKYLQPIAFMVEYSNESERKWTSRMTVEWLDEEGKVIDGFEAKEGLAKQSARKINTVTPTTSKYGLGRAKTLRVRIGLEP